MPTNTSLDPLERAREACLRVLQHRPHSRQELLIKLRRKKIADEVSNQILDRLTEVGLVDDEQFARAWVESRQNRRPQGNYGLRAELAKRGVSREIISTVLSDALEEEDSFSTACRALRPKTRQLLALPRANAERKASQFLLRRGFDYETVRKAVECILEG